MKKLSTHLLILSTALAVSSCFMFDRQDTPKAYIRHCVKMMDMFALYAEGPQWEAEKAQILKASETIHDMDSVHTMIGEALKVAGGKHSFLLPPLKDTASYPENVPEVKMLEGGIAYVLLPSHTGVKVSDDIYTRTVLDFLQENMDSRGVIVDLRGNTGGNMGPMIASLSPLLPDGTVLRFRSKKRTIPVILSVLQHGQGLKSADIKKFPTTTPLAILTDSLTASSGEATLLCFRGLGNARTFGGPSAGYASANQVFPLADGYQLVITTSYDVARTDEEFCDDPIAPDVQTETPLEDALAWITEKWQSRP